MGAGLRRPWRLRIDALEPDAPGHGFWNMGVDEALLEAVVEGGPPTLRLYTWDGPWLSLGYGQPEDPARRAACEAAGVGLVRRATGGRAVLHGGDLTYCLAAPAALLPPGLQSSYERVGEGLLAAVRSLGIEAECRDAGEGARAVDFDCFAAPADHELCVAGRKLVGSAQRRSRGGVLQHGSIRLEPDPAPARDAAGLRPETATSLREEGFRGTLRDLVDACQRELARVLEADLQPGPLSEAERRFASLRGERRQPSRISREPLDGR